MTHLTIILLALALAMDAFAVSIASGIAIKDLRIKHSLIIASWFGIFQAIMPLLGWLSGIKLQRYICEIDHWIVFGLLFFIGCKMIYEAFKIEEVEKKTDPMDVAVLFSLSIATSIDAFGVGLSFALLSTGIAAAAAIIGIISFIFSFAGVMVGSRLAARFGRPVEIAGGIVLVIIGIRILFEHLGP